MKITANAQLGKQSENEIPWIEKNKEKNDRQSGALNEKPN
jgi:hypothetical protein